jgi:hypothetical protein
VTYLYQLLISGEPWGKPLTSSREVQTAVQRYIAEHREGKGTTPILVGRFLTGEVEAPDQRSEVYQPAAFMPNARNPDPDEQFWHRRIRDLLNSGLEHRQFFLWLNVEGGTGETSFNESAFLDAVEAWLTRLHRLVYQQGLEDIVESLEGERFHLPDGEWSWQGKKFHWSQGGLELDLSAIPRRTEVRDQPADQVVGNPEPAFAYYA